MNLRTRHSKIHRTRAFATVLVLGIIIIASITIAMLQVSAFGQAAQGRESMARARAYWAARAGLEAQLAALERVTEEGDSDDARRAMDDMAEVAEGELTGATYKVIHSENGEEVLGAADTHAKLNVNRLTREQLLTIEPFLTEDTADSILDWIDSDDDTRELGAELGYYQSLSTPYAPRNGPLRTIAELELISGTTSEDVRGEDWNLNGVLDPNEDDGDASWPPDNSDGVLDAGWSGVLTTESREGGLASSGKAKLDLKEATESDVAARVQASTEQSKVVVDYISENATATLADFIRDDLGTLQRRTTAGRQQTGGRRQTVEPLSREQLALLVDECSVGAPALTGMLPGKLNVNSCDAKTLEFLPEIDAGLAESIIAERSGKPQGFKSIVDLLDVPGMTRRRLSVIYELLCTRSNVFVVVSRGRDNTTGIEVEIRAVLDRSQLPVTLTDVRVR